MPIPEPNLQRPRLIANPNSWTEIRARRKTDARFDALLNQIELNSKALLTADVCAYEKIGRRLLAVSRLVLRRVLFLSLTYRVTEDPIYLRRAEAEMLSAAKFKDWNPSHFLDTAEMMAGLAFGYDWLHDELTPEAREIIRDAIIQKGLQEVWAGGKPHGFIHSTNNWNQVCFAGATLAALSVWDEAPDLARRTVELVPEHNKIGQAPYAPEGVYPEGPMYWSYGTSFEVVLISALRRAFNTDFGLGSAPGFMASAAAQLQLNAPSGDYFNFSDCRVRGGLEPALYWFSKELKQPSLLQFQLPQLDKWASLARKPDTTDGESRLVTLMALWWPEKLDGGPELPLTWHGVGDNSLAIFRSSWSDPHARYLAIKGGSAGLSHGHMDVGSFIYESQGVRWAHDLGMQEYNSLESRGINMWDRKQGGVGWKVFRLGPFSHNTLTIDGQEHRVNGNAKIEMASGPNGEQTATLDLSPIFAGQLKTAQRQFWLKDEWVKISDDLTGLTPGSQVRWAMFTRAQVTLDGPVALLKQDGKELWLGFDCDSKLEVASAPATPPNDYDAPNPGFTLLSATITTPPSGVVKLHSTFGPTRPPVKPA